jgi:hypothetical protein
MKEKIILAIIICLFSGSIFAFNDNEINESNWQNHPQIKEIREIFNEVEGEIKYKNVIELRKVFEYTEPYLPTLKVLYCDKFNTVRKYIEEDGSEDSALKFNYYYDQKPILRFVYITGGAVNGSKIEHRIYFNSGGKRIWEIQKYLKGPGYSFPKVWPENELVFDPWKEFNKKNNEK